MRSIVSGLCRASCVAALLLPAPAGMAAEALPTVQVVGGTLSGIHEAEAGLDEFKGIPYAAPPVGALRWKPPQPVAAWQGVRRADRFAARCMQRPLYGDMVFRSNGMSEDCLYLNVWTPTHRNGRLPVLVYFYGGSLLAGDGSEPRYDGASLARRGIVTVTVNYRLDVLGLLALPQLAAESPQHATGNYSLLDMAAALRWVHANIAAFGGNADAVTIGGESAGSMAVSALMASPLSRGLMQRAIGESGAVLGNLQPMPRAEAEARGEALMRRLGVHTLAELRRLPADTLLNAMGSSDSGGFDITLDGVFLPRSPAAIYAVGAQAHIPLLVGSNTQEGNWPSLLHGQPPTPAGYRQALASMFGAHAGEALRLYPGHDEAEVKASATALASDQFIAFSTWCWMDWQRRTGQAPVYYYQFGQPRPARRDGRAGPDTGAVHSGEIEYALGNLAGNPVYAWTATDRQVSAVMEGYFANFIKTGDPNGANLPRWPAVAPTDGGLLRQAIRADTHAYIDRDAARYEFLQRVEPDAHL